MRNLIIWIWKWISIWQLVLVLFRVFRSPGLRRKMRTTYIAKPGRPPQQPRFHNRVLTKERIIMMIIWKRTSDDGVRAQNRNKQRSYLCLWGLFSHACCITHVALHVFIMQVLASQYPFLANRNAELAVPPSFWPANRIKIGWWHVALLSGSTVYSVFCGKSLFIWRCPSL